MAPHPSGTYPNESRQYKTALTRRLCMGICALALLSVLAVKTAASTPHDIVQLDCKLAHRVIAGIVLFKKLKMLRLVYGDGGIVDWHNVDYSKPLIVGHDYIEGKKGPKPEENPNGLIISSDYKDLIYVGAGEFSRGRCTVVPKQSQDMTDPKKDNAYWMRR
jgi:hypothetical protein